MKSIVDFINEKQNFLIKGHTTDQTFGTVDLGLPSGTKWAACNIGASKPEEPGLLFQWGRVDGYEYGDKNHKFIKQQYNIKTSSNTIYGKGDILKPEDDAAYQATKGRFKIPTEKQCKELIFFTNESLQTINNINCLVLTSINNNRQLILPLCGYWDSTFSLYDSFAGFWTNSHEGKDWSNVISCTDEPWMAIEASSGIEALNIRPVLV